MDDCTETIRMRCVGLFPKPSASCGVFNEDTKTFLTSVPFDRVVTLRNHTYEVTLTNQYFMRDWTSYINISFKCYFVIDNTSWRRGITYKLFGGKSLTFLSPCYGYTRYIIVYKFQNIFIKTFFILCRISISLYLI